MAQEYAEAAIAVAIEHGLSLYQATSTVALGWAFIEQGRTEEAIEQIRNGLAAFESTGTELLRPHFLALMAEALDKAGHGAESLRVLEDALQVADRHGERYYEAELYRLKGELLVKHTTARAVSQAAVAGSVVEAEWPVTTNAEMCFRRSIRIAQQQKAKSIELRAVVSMGRLLQNQSKREEARAF